MEIYDRPGVRLRLKVRSLKAEVIETLLYGCMTWSPHKPDYDKPRQVNHSMLLRCPGWRKRKRDDHSLWYADAIAKTASESIEAIVRKRRILFAGFIARMGEERLLQRVMFGELVRSKGYSGGADKDWMAHLKEDMSVFGMEFEGCRKDAQKAGGWFRRVEEGTGHSRGNVMTRRYAELQRDTQKPRQRHPPSAPLSGREGVGGKGGGVLPKRLKSGSGHHRLEACEPSHGRHKLALHRRDFFALLRSPPSAIDALDTLYEPNAIFSQFLGSASMVCFTFPFLVSSCLLFIFLSYFVFSYFLFFAFLSFLFFCFF